MAHILGLAGSLRQGSFNSWLLRAAAEVAPTGTTIEIASIRGIPLYDADAEAAEGVPPVVEALKNRIAAADALLIATPEYNNSIPGVVKNAVDWLSRPPADIARVFANRPVAVIGATPGLGATALAQAAWLPVFRTLRMRPWFGERLTVAGARNVFDANGRLTDDAVRAGLASFIESFAEFVDASR
jgi:NAD(P)H-dependent FMN reductase